MDDLQYVALVENLEMLDRPMQHRNRFENIDPFEILSENQFLATFRLSKDLCRFLIDTVAPFMRPQRRATDLSVTTRVRFSMKVQATIIHYISFNRFW